jgi:predicted dehydrogenase
MGQRTNRREFLQTSTAAGGLLLLGPGASARGYAANEKLNVACIGVGGRGNADMMGVAGEHKSKDKPRYFDGENIVAICDVDERSLDAASKDFPQAKRYNDFRKMLDEMHKSIDAVTVGTPDHTNAPAAMAAMRLGKHVYCEKPLTHSIHEARTLTETAAKMKVATQMGNQGHSGDNTRRIVEIVRSGGIGPIREVHAWTNRPIWPQGRDRPQGSDPVPDYLKWDLWLGPAPARPYVANKLMPAEAKKKAREDLIYHPFAWRGWWDFGTGALGDMACHILDASFWALDLKYPTVVEVLDGEPRKPDNGPKWEIIRYNFPARGAMPPLQLTWYDGGKKPPIELFEGEDVSQGGALLIGEKGKLYVPHDYGGKHTFLPKAKFEGYQNPPETIPRVPGANHHKDWVSACKNPDHKACSNFSYSGPLTEMVLLGVVAFRTGQKIEWDGPNMKATNSSAAEEYIRPAYRKGWEL